MIVLLIYKPY